MAIVKTIGLNGAFMEIGKTSIGSSVNIFTRLRSVLFFQATHAEAPTTGPAIWSGCTVSGGKFVMHDDLGGTKICNYMVIGYP